MPVSVAEAAHRADLFFMKQSPTHQAIERIGDRLDQMGIQYVILGGMAVNIHGHQRMTTDINLLLRREDLQRFKDQWVGRGWVEKFAGSKGMRDAVLNVPIDVIFPGEYPGDGLEKPIVFPEPSESFILMTDGRPFISLPRLIEFKLASGMTAEHRPRDFDDVIQLIRRNHLASDYGDQLNPYVHEAWQKYWRLAQINEEF